MTEAKHTALTFPLSFKTSQFNTNLGPIWMARILDAEGESVSLYMDTESAEQIVTAVNSHDALLAVYEVAKVIEDFETLKAHKPNGVTIYDWRLKLRHNLSIATKAAALKLSGVQ